MLILYALKQNKNTFASHLSVLNTLFLTCIILGTLIGT